MSDVTKRIEKAVKELTEEEKEKARKYIPVINSIAQAKETIPHIKTKMSFDYVDSFQKQYDALINNLARDYITEILYKAKRIALVDRKPIQDVIEDLLVEQLAHRKASTDYSLIIYRERMEAFTASLNIPERLKAAGFEFVQGVKDSSVKDWVDEVRVAMETHEFLEDWESIANRFLSAKIKIGHSIYKRGD